MPADNDLTLFFSEKAKFLPLPLEVLAGHDLGELGKKALEVTFERKEEAKEAKEEKKGEKKEDEKDEKKEDKKDEKKEDAKEEEKKEKAEEKDEEKEKEKESQDGEIEKKEGVAVTATRKGDTITITSKGTVITVTSSGPGSQVNGGPELKDEAAQVLIADVPDDNESDDDDGDEARSVVNGGLFAGGPALDSYQAMPLPTLLIDDLKEEDSLYLGLRVYTKKDAAAVISAQLRQELEVSAASKLAL